MNGRPEPTSNRGRHAQSTWQRGHLAQAKADYERRREPDDPEWSDYAADLDARSMHYGTPGHPTTRRLYAGAYSEETYAAALAQLQAQSAEHNRPRPPMTPAQRASLQRIRSAWSGGTFSHDDEPVMTAADALAALDQLDTGVSFTG